MQRLLLGLSNASFLTPTPTRKNYGESLKVDPDNCTDQGKFAFSPLNTFKMKKRTKNITIALSMVLLILGGLASIPADGTVLAGKGLSSDSETQPNGGGGDNYMLSLTWCSRTWICRDGTIHLTTGTALQCVWSAGSSCSPSSQSPCNAPRPDCYWN